MYKGCMVFQNSDFHSILRESSTKSKSIKVLKKSSKDISKFISVFVKCLHGSHIQNYFNEHLIMNKISRRSLGLSDDRLIAYDTI